jgi:hypothetical protein
MSLKFEWMKKGFYHASLHGTVHNALGYRKSGYVFVLVISLFDTAPLKYDMLCFKVSCQCWLSFMAKKKVNS